MQSELGDLSRFGNECASETAAGALPIGRNSPQRRPLGLYAEQISGTPCTAPRRFRVALPDDMAGGYNSENHRPALRLSDPGPIGAN